MLLTLRILDFMKRNTTLFTSHVSPHVVLLFSMVYSRVWNCSLAVPIYTVTRKGLKTTFFLIQLAF